MAALPPFSDPLLWWVRLYLAALIAGGGVAAHDCKARVSPSLMAVHLCPRIAIR